jgi:hypothetical protein
MIIEYMHASRIGAFIIRLEQTRAGLRWGVYCNGEALGWYVTPQVAIEEVAGGSCDWPGTTNPADLNISDDIGDWTPTKRS